MYNMSNVLMMVLPDWLCNKSLEHKYNKKLNYGSWDLDDVTLGNSAIFLDVDISFIWGSTGCIKIRGFPPPSHDRYGFVETGIYTPNRTDTVLLGATLGHFEVFSHAAILN